MDPKRKTDGTSVTVEEHYNDRDVKRIKTSDFLPQYGETPEGTTEAGLELLELLTNCRDENGRDAAAAFRTLPPLRGNEAYYAKIKAPIALDTVKRRLKNREFANLTELESYLKRFIQNCKETTARDELLHGDAERLRKLIATWMQMRNPAYSDLKADYVSLPAPLTDEFIALHPARPYLPGQRCSPAKRASYQHDGAGDGDADMQDAYGEEDEQQTRTSTSATPNPETPAPDKRRPGRPPKNASRRASSTPAPDPRTGEGFNGITLQQAQEKIIEEMMQEKETADDDWPKYDPFIRLPPRSLRDYYAVIPHPVSLNTLKKNVRGPGHNEVTKYDTWDDFEEEVSLLWKNAHHYNEDGSAISELASDLEIFFNKRLAAAKKTVEQPSKQKIKLKLSAPAPAPAQEPVSTPRNSLRMVVKDNSASSSVAMPASVATPMSASSPSQAAAHQSQQTTMAPPSNLGQADRRSSLTRASPKPVGSATPSKQEVKTSPALPPTISAPPAPQTVPPILNPTRSNENSMAPPMAMNPSASMNGTQPNGVVMDGGYSQPAPQQPPAAAPSVAYDYKWRMPDKAAADALISKIHINTHPGLNLRKHFHMEILADDNLAQQSYTITLPADHYWLQITPTLNASLAQRHHKSFGIASNVRLTPFPPLPGQAVDRLAPLYEHRLKPGVNVLEFEVIAAAPEGSKSANAQHVEFEKITILANLQKL